jgi:ketosteroid isomerase-like protein
VFGEADRARRAAAIAELYIADCMFFEAEEHIVGREALSAKVEQIRDEAPVFVFSAAGPGR